MHATTVIARPAETHPSRWGFHPCDYETYRLLKRLHAAYQKALAGYHAWLRWSRKAPHNRVLRRRVRDASGRVIGREVVGPRPEPALCPVFVCRERVRVNVHEGRYHHEGIEIERVTLQDLGVPDDYCGARFPVATAAQVSPLTLSRGQVEEMLARLERAGS